jgi:hypothetical protein
MLEKKYEDVLFSLLPYPSRTCPRSAYHSCQSISR